MLDVENFVCAPKDGYVVGASRDVGGWLVACVVFQTPQLDAGRSGGGRKHKAVIQKQTGDGSVQPTKGVQQGSRGHRPDLSNRNRKLNSTQRKPKQILVKFINMEIVK